MTMRSCRRARSSRAAGGAAHRLPDLPPEFLEVTLGEPRATGAGDHVAQRVMDGVGRPLGAEFAGGLMEEIHVKVDVRALDHSHRIHLMQGMPYTCGRSLLADRLGRIAAS